MAKSSPIARLTDIIEAIELIQSEMADVTLDAFEADRRKRWLVERGLEIISEASRRLPLAMKTRRPEIPWPKVAGIGNIYSNEAMWLARLKPMRRAGSLKPAEAAQLYKSIGSILRRALECCLHPAPNFRDPNWWFQGIEDILNVYGREDLKCRRDGHPILRSEQGGRSTFWCKACQK